MSKMIPENHKRLTLNDRLFIEQSLDEGKSFREISKYLCKDPSPSLMKSERTEPQTHGTGIALLLPITSVSTDSAVKTNAYNRLILYDTYYRICTNVCDQFERKDCHHINKAPSVCNGCPIPRNKCQVSTKYDYNAKAAHRKYSKRLSAPPRNQLDPERTAYHRHGHKTTHWAS